MIKIGQYNKLKVTDKTESTFFLGDEINKIPLPAKELSKEIKLGDIVDVFIYHDSEGNELASIKPPLGVVGDVVKLKVVDTTPTGSFLDWGLPKDLFIHKSQQYRPLKTGDESLVLIYLDNASGRIAATERIEDNLSNENLTVKEMQEVDLVVLRATEIGYIVMINNKHLGMLHYNEVFIDLFDGEKMIGFVKTIKEDNKLDIVLGRAGFAKVEDEARKIIDLLNERGGFLPYHDKSLPDDIYAVFGMSKKTFKMTIGSLYKQKQITITSDGISLVKN